MPPFFGAGGGLTFTDLSGAPELLLTHNTGFGVNTGPQLITSATLAGAGATYAKIETVTSGGSVGAGNSLFLLADFATAFVTQINQASTISGVHAFIWIEIPAADGKFYWGIDNTGSPDGNATLVLNLYGYISP